VLQRPKETVEEKCNKKTYKESEDPAIDMLRSLAFNLQAYDREGNLQSVKKMNGSGIEFDVYAVVSHSESSDVSNIYEVTTELLVR